MKPIADAWRTNPDARAYWQALRASSVPRVEDAEDAPRCPDCNDLGVVRGLYPLGHPLFGKLLPCPNPNCATVQARRQARLERLTAASHIPDMYKTLTFASWDALAQKPERMTGKWDALGAALAFVDARDQKFMFSLADAAQRVGLTAESGSAARRNSIVFSGPNGVGKTSLAVSIAQELIRLSVPTVYVRLAEFFDALKERFSGGKDTYEFGGDAGDEAGLLAMYQQADVLIIDEFAAQVTDWRRERAEQLINYRYTHQLPTVITTNIAAEKLPDVWGLILGHRVQAMSHCIHMSGVELRQRRRERKSR